MQIDMDYYTEKAPSYLSDMTPKDTERAIIRIFGVNAQGNSVSAHVYNFTSYFYVQVTNENRVFNDQ